MKTVVWSGLAVLAAGIAAPAAAQQTGDWVLAQWRGESAWFPGVVAGRDGNQITIHYDDGTSEVRPANQVRPFDWHAGSAITCQWTDGSWYPAHITTMGQDGITVDVRFDDGDTLHTQTGRCRVDE